MHTRSALLQPLTEALVPHQAALTGFGLLHLAGARRCQGDQLTHQTARGGLNLRHSVIKSRAVGSCGLPHAADLADVLQGARVNLIVGGGGLEVEQEGDVPAHDGDDSTVARPGPGPRRPGGNRQPLAPGRGVGAKPATMLGSPLPELQALLERHRDGVEVWVQYPRWAMVKRRSNGRVDFVSPLPCPYNYGEVPGEASGDGDALDAVVLGRRLSVGTRLKVPVRAVVDFVDGGLADPKLVCSFRPLHRWDVAGLDAFFTAYAAGKAMLAAARGQTGPTRFGGILVAPGG